MVLARKFGLEVLPMKASFSRVLGMGRAPTSLKTLPCTVGSGWITRFVGGGGMKKGMEGFMKGSGNMACSMEKEFLCISQG